MANEFIARNGLIAQQSSVVTGSLRVTQGITGSLFGTASYITGSAFTSANRALSASYALTASYLNLLNQVVTITGSLQVNGAISASNYQTTWSDFSAASQLVGWSATTRKVVRYTSIGTLGIVEYDIFGTSNSSTIATFTLPFTASGTQVTQSNNNQSFNGTTVPSGQASVASGSTLAVCNFYTTAVAFGLWGTSKGVRGVLTLEIK